MVIRDSGGEVRVVPLGAVEKDLAGMVGLRRLAALGIRVSRRSRFVSSHSQLISTEEDWDGGGVDTHRLVIPISKSYRISSHPPSSDLHDTPSPSR